MSSKLFKKLEVEFLNTSSDSDSECEQKEPKRCKKCGKKQKNCICNRKQKKCYCDKSQVAPSFLTNELASILEDAKLWKFDWLNSFDYVKNLTVLNVIFTDSSTSAQISVNFGNGFTGNNTPPLSSGVGTNLTNAPTSITVSKPLETGYYSLFMQDVDALSASTRAKAPIMHYGVANIPVTSASIVSGITNLNTTIGNTIFPYIAPSSAVNSGLHRYVFFLFKQGGIESFSNLPSWPTGVSNGRAFMFLDRVFSVYYTQGKPNLIAINYLAEYNIDPAKNNFPIESAEGSATVTSGTITSIITTFPAADGRTGVYLPMTTFTFNISQPGNSLGVGATATATTNISGQIATLVLGSGGSGYTGSSFTFFFPSPAAFAATF